MSAWGGRRVATIRAAVAERYGPVCWLCAGLIGDGDPWDVDHVVPRVAGGGDELDNLRPAHASCNRSRGARAPVGARPWHRWAL